MKIKKKKKSKIIASFIVGIFLMFSIIISVLSLFIKFTVLNSEKYINILEKKEIYTQMYEFLDGNLGYTLMVKSIESDVKDGVISQEELETDVNSFIRSLMNYFVTGINGVKKVDTDKYLNRFDENLNKYIRENSVFVNSSVQSDIDILKNEISQIIKSELEIINSDIIINSSVGMVLARITNLFVRGFYLIPIMVVGILILILNFIWRGDIIRFSQWVGSSLMAAGLFIFILFFSGYISGFYNNVSIYTIYLRNFVVNLIKSWMIILWLSGMVISVLGTLMLTPLIKSYIKRSKMRKKA